MIKQILSVSGCLFYLLRSVFLHIDGSTVCRRFRSADVEFFKLRFSLPEMQHCGGTV